jgi:hypothetical protein
VDIESIEAGTPEPVQVSHPSIRIIERLCAKAAGSPLGPARSSDQASVLEYLQMSRDRGKTDIERLGKLRDGRIPSPQALQDPPAGGIGQG